MRQVNSNINIFIDCFNIAPIGYFFDYENSLFMSCFTQNKNNNDKLCEECYADDFINYLKCFEECDYNYDKCISKDTKYISKEVYRIKINSNTFIYSYDINTDINELKKIYQNLPFIEISSDIKNFLINEFKLDEEKDKIYVLMNEYSNNDSNSTTSDYNYKFI